MIRKTRKCEKLCQEKEVFLSCLDFKINICYNLKNCTNPFENWKKKKKNCSLFRPATRRQGASFSYKENSAEETGSEDLVEVEWGQEEVAAAVESENAETIERIVDTRMGRKGGWIIVFVLKLLSTIV